MFCSSPVYDFIPLKQGLKLRVPITMPYHWTVYDFIPLKQGLKHFSDNVFSYLCTGLWLYSIKTRIETQNRHIVFGIYNVYDFIPLKQGLKQKGNIDDYQYKKGLWLYSIKTRIETV